MLSCIFLFLFFFLYFSSSSASYSLFKKRMIPEANKFIKIIYKLLCFNILLFLIFIYL